jgi:tellurite resistance protein
MGGILRIEPEGRETYYSIAPSWKKKNEPLTAVIAAIGSAESNYSESMISEAIPKVMQNFGQADFEKLTQEQRAIIKCTLDHIQQIGPDIFATFGKMKEINRCLAAIYILRLKGNDELAELFMRMCKKQTDILVDSYMRVIGSAAIMRREILSRLREAKKAGTISNQEYRDAVTQYEQQVLVPKIRIEIPDDLSEKKFLREITDDYLIQK